MKLRLTLVSLTVLVLIFSSFSVAQAQKAADAPTTEAVLKPADIGNKLLPEKVFFRGQIAPVQARNTGGVRYADGFFVIVGLVDNSGYSSGIREKISSLLHHGGPRRSWWPELEARRLRRWFSGITTSLS